MFLTGHGDNHKHREAPFHSLGQAQDSEISACWQGEPLGEPQISLCTEAGRQPAPRAAQLGQAPSLPQPPAHLGKTLGPRTLSPSSRPSAVSPGLCDHGQASFLPPSVSSPSSPGAQRKSLVPWLPPSICVCATRDKDQCTEGGGAAGAP